jgi:hypothetical protein
VTGKASQIPETRWARRRGRMFSAKPAGEKVRKPIPKGRGAAGEGSGRERRERAWVSWEERTGVCREEAEKSKPAGMKPGGF